MEQLAWTMLQVYFAPFKMPALMGETDKWIAAVSLNGIRSANLCKPN